MGTKAMRVERVTAPDGVFYGRLYVSTSDSDRGVCYASVSRRFGQRGRQIGILQLAQFYTSPESARKALRRYLRQLRDEIDAYLEDTKGGSS